MDKPFQEKWRQFLGIQAEIIDLSQERVKMLKAAFYAGAAVAIDLSANEVGKESMLAELNEFAEALQK